MSQARYPLPRPQDDPRFTLGFILQVGEVLAEHGFPPIDSGADYVRLQQALFTFIYETRESAVAGSKVCDSSEAAS